MTNVFSMAAKDRDIEDRAFHRLAADLIIRNGDRIVLVRRGIEPFKGRWCIPGGHVEHGEQVEEAAVREAKEETGLDVAITDTVGVYDAPGRDPRGPVVSIVFEAETDEKELTAATDAREARWFGLDELPPEMGFDHRDILEEYLAD